MTVMALAGLLVMADVVEIAKEDANHVQLVVRIIAVQLAKASA